MFRLCSYRPVAWPRVGDWWGSRPCACDVLSNGAALLTPKTLIRCCRLETEDRARISIPDALPGRLRFPNESARAAAVEVRRALPRPRLTSTCSLPRAWALSSTAKVLSKRDVVDVRAQEHGAAVRDE